MNWNLSLRKLQNLHVLDFLASGVFGKVYLVRSLDFGQILVAKVSHDNSKQYLFNEYRWMSKNADSNIAPQVWIAPFRITVDTIPEFEIDSWVLFQSYLPGITLQQLVEKGINQKMCIELTGKLLELIEKFHRSNYAHRDLSPSNLIWNPLTGELKLIDFGLSCREDSVPLLCGTFLYMPPELILKTAYCPLKGDMFSVGALIRYIWIQQPVYLKSRSRKEYIRNIQNSEYDYAQISYPAAQELMLLLTNDALERPSAIEAVQIWDSS